MKEINKLKRVFEQLDIPFSTGCEEVFDHPDMDYIKVGTTHFYFHTPPLLAGQFKSVSVDIAREGVWIGRLEEWQKRKREKETSNADQQGSSVAGDEVKA